MRLRWILATIGAAALAAVAVTTSLPWLREGGPPAGGACPVDAPAANLDFTLNDLDNKGVTLADYRGKVILLDFWATWCGPCKIEIPNFIELQNQYGPRGLQVLGVSVDDTLELLEPYVAEMKMNYPVLQGLGRDDMMEAYGPIPGLPTTMLISRDGKICAKHFGYTEKEAFETDIKELL
jgi:thiol-disulfide isomerase/thioredoxin